MSYRRFEELPVWQDAADLARATFELTSDSLFRPHAGLRNQLERASVSVSNNIAEGFERGSNNELLAFLYIASGSAGETRSMLRVLEKWDIFWLRRKQLGDLTKQCENISRQLYRWIEQIKRSGFRGQRHLNMTLQSPSPKVKARDTGGEIDLKSRK